MKYATVASGVEAPSVAFSKIDKWEPVWFSQYDPEHNYKASGPDFPSRVLAYHYPHVPNLGDMLKLHQNKIFNESRFDVLCGGTPCQGFSLAGLRKGLDDERSNLSLEFCRILATKQPRWFLWENVPGVHSTFSNDQDSEESADSEKIVQTSDFARLLEAFHECGYSVSWRILDSQYFGVPQRRKRVYVVGHLGTDWRPPFAVLFEQESLRRDLTPVKAKGKRTPGETTGSIDASYGRLQGCSGQDMNHGHSTLVPVAYGGNNRSGPIDVATAIKGDNQNMDFESETFLVNEQACSYNMRDVKESVEISGTIQAKESGYSLNYIDPIVYNGEQITSKANGSNPKEGDPVHALTDSAAQAILIAKKSSDTTAFNVTFNDSNGVRKDRKNGGCYVNESDQANTLKKAQDVNTLIVSDDKTSCEESVLWSIMPQNSGKDYKAKESHVAQPVLTSPGKTGNQGAEMVQQSYNTDESIQSFQPKASSSQSMNLSEVSQTLETTKVPAIIQKKQIVRRLTPLECERLQAFPDLYTFIPLKKVSKKSYEKAKNKNRHRLLDDGNHWLMAADGLRYQAMGNSMTTFVIHWIGTRIDKVDKLLTELKR